MGKEKFKVYEGVFDEFTLLTLENLKRRKYFDELGRVVKTGKEAVVYSVIKGDEKRVVKIYRLTAAIFSKITDYIKRDFRFRNVKGNLRRAILMWVSKEFRNLLICYKAGMSVPTPFKQYNNVLVMEYIAGPMLKDASLENPREFFELILEQLKIMRYKAKLIHGDLSEFNILVRDEMPVIIDFGQGMSVKTEDEFNEFLDLYKRDVHNVVDYFNSVYKLDLDEEEVLKELDKSD